MRGEKKANVDANRIEEDDKDVTFGKFRVVEDGKKKTLAGLMF